jgi:hypothetical protein
MGGKPLLRIFLKGDRNLVDSLLSIQEGGQALDRGIRGLVEEKYPGRFKIEWVCEPFGRADLLLQQLERPGLPEELRRLGLAELDFIKTQFQSRLFEEESDIVVLSIGSEIAYPLWKHRRRGYLLCPPLDWEEKWSVEQKKGFQEQFDPVGMTPVEIFKETYAQLINRIKERLNAHVLVFNCSSLDPGDLTHNYRQVEDTLALRIHRFNLALMQLSMSEGVSIIDVDRLIAELKGGGEKHVLEALRYSKEVYQTLCEEFLRVLADIGFFEKRPLVMQVGQQKGRK